MTRDRGTRKAVLVRSTKKVCVRSKVRIEYVLSVVLRYVRIRKCLGAEVKLGRMTAAWWGEGRGRGSKPRRVRKYSDAQFLILCKFSSKSSTVLMH